MKLPIIQSLWIGKPLSNLEKLCIQSFLDYGHEFHLYTYAKLDGVPKGAVIKDANEILPSKFIYGEKTGRIASFSDWFRYALLAKRGGFWVDTDVICIKPFAFTDSLVVGKERYSSVCTAVIGVQQPQHPLLVALRDACADFPKIKPWDDKKLRRRKWKLRLLGRGRESTRWGEVGGPLSLTNAMHYFNLMQFAKPHTYFYPIPYEVGDSIFDDTFANGYNWHADTYAMHFWNNRLKTWCPGKDKNSTFAKNSLIEQLKRQYKIA